MDIIGYPLNPTIDLFNNENLKNNYRGHCLSLNPNCDIGPPVKGPTYRLSLAD